MKTFAIFSNYFGYSIGGSEYSMFKFLQEKESAGWKIVVFLNSSPGGYNAKEFKMQFPSSWEVREYKLPFQFLRFRYISYVLNKYTLSKIATNMNDIKVLALYGHTSPAIIKKFSGKTLFFVRDECALGLDKNYYEGLNKFLFNIYSFLQYPFRYFWIKDLIFCLNKSKIIVNSRYIAKLTKSIYGKRHIQIVYPDIDYENLKNDFLLARNLDIKKGIVLIGDHVTKGSLTFRRIAMKMPYLNFYIFDKKYKKIEKNKKIINITLMPWTSRGELFNHASMLLMPSHIDEAFGRSIVEARSLGIPVLSSDKGGLPEAIGNKFFLVRPVDDIDQWIAKIKIVLHIK